MDKSVQTHLICFVKLCEFSVYLCVTGITQSFSKITPGNTKMNIFHQVKVILY